MDCRPGFPYWSAAGFSAGFEASSATGGADVVSVVVSHAVNSTHVARIAVRIRKTDFIGDSCSHTFWYGKKSSIWGLPANTRQIGNPHSVI